MSGPTNQIRSLSLQIRPLFPPDLTDFLRVLPKHRKFRGFSGFVAYRKACLLRAKNQGLNLPLSTISSIASILWRNESVDIKNTFLDIAKQVTHIYDFHNAQFGNISNYIIEIRHQNLH
ncbi:18372_t:CDS:1 [Rhizophagus irregularis]|nr:18372_t:CDS:1 [Rhizophagus irregularis]